MDNKAGFGRLGASLRQHPRRWLAANLVFFAVLTTRALLRPAFDVPDLAFTMLVNVPLAVMLWAFLPFMARGLGPEPLVPLRWFFANAPFVFMFLAALCGAPLWLLAVGFVMSAVLLVLTWWDERRL